MNKLLVVPLAVILLAGFFGTLASTAYAQNATGLQIQLIPEIQRGHKQHITVFAVDDQGNQINDTEITTQLTNEAGRSVGPGQVTSGSGDLFIYKVGPNTRPQNISVFSFIEGSPVQAAQTYAVFPKGQAQVAANDTATPAPLPIPTPIVNATVNATVPEINATIPEINATLPAINATSNATIPSVNITIPEVNATIPATNQTLNATIPASNETTEGPGGVNTTEPGVTPTEPPVFDNSTQAFDNLANATGSLDLVLQDTGDDANETERADIRAAIGESSAATGEVSALVINATDDQLQIMQDSAISVSEAIDIIRDEGE